MQSDQERTIRRMTDEEVIAEIKSTSKLNKARAFLSSTLGKAEQAALQRKRPISPIEQRRLEFEAVKKIAEILNEK